MSKIGINKSGIALFMVLTTVVVIVLWGEVTLKFMASQNRFTHESVNRIQAYYAAKAGMTYALEMLRTGTWTFTPVNSCSPPAGCLFNEPNFPSSILSFDSSSNRQFRVIFCPSGSFCSDSPFQCQPPVGINFCINTTVTYQ